MTGPLRVPRLVPSATDVLEQRARALAAGGAGEVAEGAARPLRLVAFRLGGRSCAVEMTSLDRVVLRLARPLAVPLATGGERLVTFVEERPVPVADLAGLVAGAVRGTGALAGAPALVVSTPTGAVAVAVEGPLELAEGALAGAAAAEASGDGALLRVAGVLKDGAALVDRAWLAAWAGRVARP